MPSWRNGIRGRLRACAERRAGSSPVEGTTYGRLAQLVRAAALHAVGLGFESLVAHLLFYPLPLLCELRSSLWVGGSMVELEDMVEASSTTTNRVRRGCAWHAWETRYFHSTIS